MQLSPEWQVYSGSIPRHVLYDKANNVEVTISMLIILSGTLNNIDFLPLFFHVDNQ